MLKMIRADKETNLMQRRVRHLYFVGIGGSGMNGIAQVLINLGYQISGADIAVNSAVKKLKSMGATIYQNHLAEQIKGCDAVVVSAAISEDNPEVKAAREARIPVVPRAEMLAELMRFSYGIAVAGTHGKTTTTSLTTSLLAEAGLDPTFVIGGLLNSVGANAQLGTSGYLVVEADESDASFLYLQPMMSVVTNVDTDHMQTYDGDFNKLRQTFIEFLHHLPFYGLAVLCIDDEEVRNLLPRITRRVLTYGISEEADVKISNIDQEGMLSHFDIRCQDNEMISATLNLPGHHNVLNAAAAITVAKELGIKSEVIKRALHNFEGIGRRFQTTNMEFNGKKLILVNDYGHHPKELSVTLDAARKAWPKSRLILVFQPHRYSRTLEQFDDFVSILSTPDLLLVCEVYAAGEKLIPGADSRALTRAIRTRSQIAPIFVEDLEELPQIIAAIVEDGDVVLMMGAGSIGKSADQLPQSLERLS